MKLSRLFVSLSLIGLVAGCTKTTNSNDVPVANAGPSQTITLPTNTVNLVGTGTDTDGSIVAYLWSQVSGPNTSIIANPGSASTAINGLIQGNYLFQLMVTDDAGATGVDTVSVKVNPSPIQTLTLQPANNPNERMIISIGGSDQSNSNGTEIVLAAWTFNGQSWFGRKAMKFDLSSIPSTATIQSANLYLYSNVPPENGNLVDANFGSNNALYLQQITSNWTPATTTWSNQPGVNTATQISIPHTSQSALDLNIDVKNMVASMVSGNNYGFMLRLQNEVAYTSRLFVSSWHATKATQRPKLVVTYLP
jgi:hypothetical protein